MPSLYRCACAILPLLAGLAAGPARADQAVPASLPPLESFFGNAAFSGALLSPDARLLAVRVARGAQRDGLAVIDLTNNSAKVVAGFTDADVGNFEWVNGYRLVFDATDKTIGQGDLRNAPGLFAVNRDGSNLRQLASRNPRAGVERHNPMLPWTTSLVSQAGAKYSDYVYVTNAKYSAAGEVEHVELRRLNTVTGEFATVERPGAVRRWMLDHQGQPRIATTIEGKTASVHYRDAGGQPWRKLLEFDAYTGANSTFTPLAFGPDGTLYVQSSEGRDKRALYRFDLAAGRREAAPLVALKDYDFEGSLVIANDKLLGVHVLSDARSTIWFDPAMKALQKRIDALLPATVNIISVAEHAATPWVLVMSYSDVQPRTWNLFNTATGMLNKVGASHPQIKPARMAMQEAVRYKARDGLEIPAWLTLPNGSLRKNLPMVVLVHGGPYVRGGEWGWRPDAQFLASRGYAVLEPEFRGSTGFGNRHFVAGLKQWGLKMQDDIADGARWAIAEGIVDPKRICIAGASYGGYATLMGLINDPDLFKCGIDWLGVTDIALLYTGHWSAHSDASEDYKQYGMPELVGDLEKDAARLTATSPLQQAARIRQPLLLAYGGADMRVPIYHGRKFHEAVKATNPDVEMVVYEEEGHGWALPKNRIDFWSRVEKFLERNIGKP